MGLDAGAVADLGVLPDTGNAFFNGVIRGAVSSTVTQGIAVVTGLQSKFDWKSVAASAIGGGVAQQLNSAMGYDLKTMPFDFGKSLVSGFGGALTSAVVRGGKVSGAQVAADAFGNIIGDKLAAANGQSSGSSTGQQEDRLGDFITQNQGTWDQRYANYRQIVAAFGQANDGDRFDGIDVAGPGSPDMIRKAGASQGLKGVTDKYYRGADSVNAALSMGGQDPGRVAELLAAGLGDMNSARKELQGSSALLEEVGGRGLTDPKGDLQKLGMAGAFGDPSTVQRIAVATANAGGAGRATAQGISEHLNELELFTNAQVNAMAGDAGVLAAAPGVYMDSLLGLRRHVDTSMVYLASMSDAQMAQVGSYADRVIADGGMSRYSDNQGLAALFSGMSATNAGIRRVGEGVSAAALGLRNVANGLTQSVRSRIDALAPDVRVNSFPPELSRGAPVGASRDSPNAPLEPYNRRDHYGTSPTKADRTALGATSADVVDHNPPLVQRYYEGDPATGELPGWQISPEQRRASANDRARMELQPKDDSNAQGGDMSNYSKQMKRRYGL